MKYKLELNFYPIGAPSYQRLIEVDLETIEELANKVIEIREDFIDSEGHDEYKYQTANMSILDENGIWCRDIETKVFDLVREVKGQGFWL